MLKFVKNKKEHLFKKGGFIRKKFNRKRINIVRIIIDKIYKIIINRRILLTEMIKY